MLKKFNPSKTKHIHLINKILNIFFHTPKANKPLQFGEIKNILLLDFTGLGDIIMLTPFLQILKQNCNAKITLVCSSGSKEILSNQKLVDRFIILNGKSLSSPLKMFFDIGKIYKALKQINNITYDLALEPRGDLRHIFFMHFCKAKRKASYNYTGGECFLTDVVMPSDTITHLVEDKIYFLTQLGFNIKERDKYPKLILTPYQKEYRQKFLVENNLKGKKIIGIHPGASQDIRKWPYYADLLDMLNKKTANTAFLVFGAPSDTKQTEEIFNMGIKNKAQVFKIQTSIHNMMSLLTCCNLLVCNDSGAGHLSCALQIPTLVIFGPANPDMVKPYNPEYAHIIKAKNIVCFPCQNKCNVYPPKCLAELTAQKVYEKVKEILSGVK